MKSCHYQSNQWQLPETLWLLDRLEDCSMHQSLIQEITSASAIRNMSSRRAGKKKQRRKRKTLWLQCFEIKRHHTEDIAVVNSQLGQKYQQSVTERNLTSCDIIAQDLSEMHTETGCSSRASFHSQNDSVPQCYLKCSLMGLQQNVWNIFQYYLFV